MNKRNWLAAAAALIMVACTPDLQNRIIVPAPIEFGAAAQGAQLAALRKAYVSEDGTRALFFVGDGAAMSVHLIDKDGLMATDKILAPRKQGTADQAANDAGNAAADVLDRLYLPAGGFAVIPAQQGQLAYYRQGKLSMVSYIADQGGALQFGAAIDTGLLAKLIEAEGESSAIDVLPAVWDGMGEKNLRLVLFKDAPDALGKILVENTRALFHAVAEGDQGGRWTASDLPAPTSLADTAAIEALRQKTAEAG